MKRWPVTLAIGICAALVCRMAIAEDAAASASNDASTPAHKNGGRFAKWDKNADGKLSFDEFKARAEAFLTQVQDKKKTDKKMDPERLKKRFERLDADKDGFLSKEELAAGHKDGKPNKGGKAHSGKDADEVDSVKAGTDKAD